MRYLYLLIFILIIGCDNMNEDELKIVFLGDSITEAGVYDKEVSVEYNGELVYPCLLYTSPSPRDATLSRMPSSA